MTHSDILDSQKCFIKQIIKRIPKRNPVAIHNTHPTLPLPFGIINCHKNMPSSPPPNNNVVVTQGVELASQLYGEETANMYAGMMDEELKKVIPDLQHLLQWIPSDDGIILDTCVGSGHMLEWISKHDHHHHYKLHGIDLSTDMLNQARQRLSSSSGVAAVLGHGDMLETNSFVVEPQSCAAILNTFALHHATSEQAEMAIRDWSRLLKENGCLYLGLWEGTGYMEEYPPGVHTLFHSKTNVQEWIHSAGLEILMSRTHVEVEMGNLNTLYLICQKKNSKLES